MARAKTVVQEIEAYAKMKNIFGISEISSSSISTSGGVEYQQLRRSRICIGTMDLKIATIVLAHDATLLTMNLSDFQKVPGLKVADRAHSSGD